MVKKSEALEELREEIAARIADLETWNTLHDVKDSLGLPNIHPPHNLGKLKYLKLVTSAASDHEIINATKLMITEYPGNRGDISESDKIKLKENIWWIESNGNQSITKVTRYRITEALEGKPIWGRLSLQDFLFPIAPNHYFFNSYSSTFHREVSCADGKIYIKTQSLLASLFNLEVPTYISNEFTHVKLAEVFKELEVIEWSDQRFFLLLERIVHPEVQLLKNQPALVTLINSLLIQDNFELQEISREGGLPIYKVTSISQGVSGTPKYIIFASMKAKPDIIINDTINMDIRIASNSESCLVYDKPPPNGDLTWQMLVEWWSEKEGLISTEQATRKQLGMRLRSSLQSPIEEIFFDSYFTELKPCLGNSLPALLPQVFLHYDPRNQDQRKEPILVRQRMDFLILLRNSHRVVIELDGKHHYSNNNGAASPGIYAKMVAEDRRLKLLGYEVYRFGGAELQQYETAKTIISSFFSDLFCNHNVIT